jgi:hypothetical protein
MDIFSPRHVRLRCLLSQKPRASLSSQTASLAPCHARGWPPIDGASGNKSRKSSESASPRVRRTHSLAFSLVSPLGNLPKPLCRTSPSGNPHSALFSRFPSPHTYIHVEPINSDALKFVLRSAAAEETFHQAEWHGNPVCAPPLVNPRAEPRYVRTEQLPPRQNAAVR